MTPNQWMAIGFMSAAAISAMAAAAMMLREARYRELEIRTMTSAGGAMPDYRTFRLGGLTGVLHAIGERLLKTGRFYSQSDIAGLEGMIAVAGFNPRRILPIVLGAKLALMILIPAAAGFYCYFAAPAALVGLIIVTIAVPVGILGPDWILKLLRRPYAAALQRGVVDALDLLVVCSEAGLGLESALERVTKEMQHSNRPTANALVGLLDEIRVLPDRREAFLKFAQRSGVEGMQRLATMLSQSQQYGTPLGQALRNVADELRRDRMIKLEERAAKLPAKLVLPLILFILPCLTIVLVGSSILRLLDVLAIMAG